MISALLIALIYIAIVCVIGTMFVRVFPMPEPVPTLIWAIVAILCLLILLDAITGPGYLRLSR